MSIDSYSEARRRGEERGGSLLQRKISDAVKSNLRTSIFPLRIYFLFLPPAFTQRPTRFFEERINCWKDYYIVIIVIIAIIIRYCCSTDKDETLKICLMKFLPIFSIPDIPHPEFRRRRFRHSDYSPSPTASATASSTARHARLSTTG